MSDPQQPESGLDSELRRIEGAGLYHWAVGGLDLAAVVAKARSSGLKTSDVTSGGRDLPGGGRVNWQLAGIRDHRFGALVPFFIDWAGSTHPGATAPRAGRLGAFTVFTPDASSLRRLYEGVGLGQIDVRESEEPGIEAELIGHDKRLTVRSIRPLPRGFVI